MAEKTEIIIMAGGKGKRMKSERPKVLAHFSGEPIITRILRAVTPICPKPSIVIGYKGEEVIAATENAHRYIWQTNQLGTGHAVLQAKPFLIGESPTYIVVMNGDHPLVSEATIRGLIKAHAKSGAPITIATVQTPSFDGDFRILYNYGRVLRDENGNVEEVRELKDANEKERAMTEVNCGYYCFEPAWLWKHIDELENENTAKEYYITDLVHIAARHGDRIGAYVVHDPAEGMGVNTPEELEIALRHERSVSTPGH
jgi:bifunctional UDP-N-acetylglucosamine pyrophosphorylase/glucosamine-1-phosphate N-acetyltransferase